MTEPALASARTGALEAFGDLGVHIVVAVLTLWWSMGLGNGLYAACKYFTDSQRTVVWK